MSGAQWTADAYNVTFAAVLLTAGSLGDRFGRRLLLRWGLVTFVLASLACALAPSLGALLAGRAAQGVGAGADVAAGPGHRGSRVPRCGRPGEGDRGVGDGGGLQCRARAGSRRRAHGHPRLAIHLLVQRPGGPRRPRDVLALPTRIAGPDGRPRRSHRPGVGRAEPGRAHPRPRRGPHPRSRSGRRIGRGRRRRRCGVRLVPESDRSTHGAAAVLPESPTRGGARRHVRDDVRNLRDVAGQQPGVPRSAWGQRARNGRGVPADAVGVPGADPRGERHRTPHRTATADDLPGWC